MTQSGRALPQFIAAGAVALAVVVVIAIAWPDRPPAQAPGSDTPMPPTADRVSTGWSLLAAGSGSEAEVAAKQSARATGAASDAEAVRQRIFEDGSLRGASLDGGWGPWDGTRLSPSLELRQRFDQLLTTQGEASLGELRGLVQHLARQDLGEAGAQAVIAQWDRYTHLLASVGDGKVDLADPQSWLAELQRLQRLRVAALGPEWARAFYADEEQALVDRVQRAQLTPASAQGTSGTTANVLAADPAVPAAERFRQREATLGTAAAQRLAALDQEEAVWQQRLQSTRVELKRLQQAPELSVQQREQAIADLLNQRFSPQEQLRARTLLGL